MSSHRNQKRVRSDSLVEINDGIEREIEFRYYSHVRAYIQSLKQERLISSDIYNDMMTNGTVDDIVTKKTILGIENINNIITERKICNTYMQTQYKNEVNTWLDIVSPLTRKYYNDNKMYAHCHNLCDDLTNYIIMFM